ncbi:MAG TPA: APC family permease [Nitrososphaerales archaeon]|nr:APC family permease [Nitrososphaerales archaeon]
MEGAETASSDPHASALGASGGAPAEGLRPQLGMFDAVATGLAAILGAGIFAVIAPAAGVAGSSLLAALVIAAFVAFCNALSSAQLAANFPRSGGTYEFGSRVLGPWWGFASGWMFLTANTVGPGVIALAFGAYFHAVFPMVPARVAAVLAALLMTALNALGIRRSVRVTDVVVVLSIASLLAVVVIGLPRGEASNLAPFAPGGLGGTLQATALLFFAYTGYSRIATLVEEVRDPQRTIPRATVMALGTATLLYLAVAATALGVLGASGVSQSASPLQSAMVAVGSGVGVAIVIAGALLTTFNEGVSDLLGVSRVAFAMARQADLPQGMARLGKEQNPWRSVLFVGAISILVAGLAPFGVAVAVSSFGTLLYYTVTNLSALRLGRERRRFPWGLALAGLVGCVALAFSLAPVDVAIGLAILAMGICYRWLRLMTVREPGG